MNAQRILVCDDEPHILHVVSTKLQNADYEVLTAADGAEALEIALAEVPDLVVTDYQMPLLSGLELCTKLRADSRTGNLPAIMLTARGFSLNEQELGRTNIRKVLVKPFSPREVLSTVRQVLESAGHPAGAA